MNKLFTLTAITLLTIGLHQLQGSNSVDYQMRFENYTVKYGKSYTPAEKLYRLQVYEEKMKIIEAHNADSTQTYTMAENQFTDITQEEFVAIYLGSRPSTSQIFEEYVPTNPAANSADWSWLTKVKNQGQCGSCWAFSAVGAIESVFRVQGRTWEDLSEQQLVDCEPVSHGCDGGWPDQAIWWAANNGLQTGSTYSYVGYRQGCRYNWGPHRPNGGYSVSAGNMYSAISNYPISVLVDASNWSWYGGGVFNNCGQGLNHAVLAVGFYDDGTWLIKNSWGGWGENGHIRLSAGNTCGVQMSAYAAY